MALPLRLAAEPICRAKLGNCFILPSAQDETRVCLVVGEAGLLALAMDTGVYTDKDLETILGIDSVCFPRMRVAVHVTARGNTATWTGDSRPVRDAVAQQCDCSDPSHRCRVPQRIVEGIYSYYGRQVLEPSIRGFLSILEKQFPRNDLYLFELLQNSVDDGASIVSFSTTSGGLEFTHNGKRFTALDVLGLASVGLSTKGSDGGPKRTIGFMGVGFKAIYKRFSRVLVGDDRYGFCFQEPKTPDPSIPGHGWVMLPIWSAPSSAPSSEIGAGTSNVSRKGWCRFLLDLPRGGNASVAADLRNLPRTVPPLLGRQSLENAIGTAKTDWTLEWDRTQHRVSRPARNAPRELSSARASERWLGGSETLEVGISEQGSSSSSRKTHWQFVTLRFSPDEPAKRAYEQHIKRPWVGSGSGGSIGGGGMFEETSLFFELDAQGIPIVSAKGAVHAVLPTKLTLPCPLQWQGSWLLSVDRQEVQSVFDNDWNSCLLRQVPKLLACLLSWLVSGNSGNAKLLHSPAGLRACFYLFPQMERGGSDSPVTCFLLGQRISMQPLIEYMSTNSVVPVRARDGSLSFTSSSRVVWLPPPLVSRLSPAALEKWLGMQPLATDALCDGTGYSPLWQSSLVILNGKMMARMRSQARELLRHDTPSSSSSGGSISSSLHAAISLIAALGEIGEIDLEKCSTTFIGAASRPKTQVSLEKAGSSSSGSGSKEVGLFGGSWLPALHEWPVLFDDRASELTAKEAVWLSEDWFSLSNDVYKALRPGALQACQDRAREEGGSGPALVLLDANIERFVLTGVLPPRATVTSPWRIDESQYSSLEADKAILPSCRSLFSKCREAHPNSVITPVEACGGLLSKIARNAKPNVPLSALEQAACEQLFSWAYSANLPNALTHLLVDFGGPAANDGRKYMRLVPAAEAYLDSSYVPEAAWMERLTDSKGAPLLQFVSSIYISKAAFGDSLSARAAVGRFLVEAGARRSISLHASSRGLTAAQLGSLNPPLAPPKLRNTNPSATLTLPFNLGPINKNRYFEVDAVLSAEWTSILTVKLSPQQASSVVEAVVALLRGGEAADPATAESVPSAAGLLKGREEKSTCVRVPATSSTFQQRCYLPNKVSPPLLKRLYFLPPGQAGATAASLGVSSFVRSLAAMSWIPCAAPGSPSDAPATLVCPPCECVLEAVGAAGGDMPVARLPVVLVRALSQLPPVVLREFSFGSIKPRPPVDKLESLAAEAWKLDSQDNAFDLQADEQLYQELIGVWRGVGLALNEGRLSSSEQARVVKVVQQHAGRCAVIPASPDAIKRRVPFTRVVGLTSSSSGTPVKDDELAAVALVRVGFLLNLFDSSNSNSLEPSLCQLLKPQQSVAADTCIEFLQDLYRQPTESLGLPSPSLKKAISWAMWSSIKSSLGAAARDPNAKLSSEVIVAARTKFLKSIPNVSVFCRKGPGFTPQAYSPRWLHVVSEAGAVMPVLLDDEGESKRRNGVSKGSVLTPQHGYQPMAMLDHSVMSRDRERDAETNRLAEVERHILLVLGIARTSNRDPAQLGFALKTAASGRGETMPAASKRLEIVILLLTTLNGSAGSADVDSSLASIQLPELTRYDSITLIFQTPRMAEPEKHVVFAIWGAPAGGGAGAGAGAVSRLGSAPARPLFIRGEPEEYVAELEELILALVFGSNVNSHSTRPTKVLRLLLFLEDEPKFLKFLKRDFGGFIPDDDALSLKEEDVDGAGQGGCDGDGASGGEHRMQQDDIDGEGATAAAQQIRLHAQLRSSIITVYQEQQLRKRAAEREARERREKFDTKRGLPLPAPATEEADAQAKRARAEPASTSSADGNASAAGSIAGAQAAVVLADAFLTRLTGTVLQAPSGRGRGGISNLPAWMTDGRSLQIASEPSLELGMAPGSPLHEPREGGDTSQQQQQQPYQPYNQQQGPQAGSVPGQFDDAEEDGKKEAPGRGGPSTASSGDGAEARAAGMGALPVPPGRSAGRGLAATLPAWMTATSAAEREAGEELEWNKHTKGLGDRLLQRFGISGDSSSAPSSTEAAAPADSSSSSSSSSSFSSSSAAKRKHEEVTEIPADGSSSTEDDGAPRRRRRSNDTVSRLLIDKLAAFISELQRSLVREEVEIDWAKDLLVSAIEQLTSER